MKLKCNVCKEGSIVNIKRKPKHLREISLCLNCGKIMACAEEKIIDSSLYWEIIDSKYDEHFGGIPVEILEN